MTCKHSDESSPFFEEDAEPDFADSPLPALPWEQLNHIKITEHNILVSLSYLLFSMLQPTDPQFFTKVEDTFELGEMRKNFRTYFVTHVFSAHPPKTTNFNIESNLSLVEFCGSKIITRDDITLAYRRHVRPRKVTRKPNPVAPGPNN